MGHLDESSEHPGPEELAPGWGSNQYTVDGYLRSWSMFASGINRRRTGWRAWIGWVAAVLVITLLAGPFVVSALVSLIH